MESMMNFTALRPEEGSVKRAIIENAKKTYILARSGAMKNGGQRFQRLSQF